MSAARIQLVQTDVDSWSKALKVTPSVFLSMTNEDLANRFKTMSLTMQTREKMADFESRLRGGAENDIYHNKRRQTHYSRRVVGDQVDETEFDYEENSSLDGTGVIRLHSKTFTSADPHAADLTGGRDLQSNRMLADRSFRERNISPETAMPVARTMNRPFVPVKKTGGTADERRVSNRSTFIAPETGLNETVLPLLDRRANKSSSAQYSSYDYGGEDYEGGEDDAGADYPAIEGAGGLDYEYYAFNTGDDDEWNAEECD